MSGLLTCQVLGYRRKLTCTKTEQSTDKASEHNGRTVFMRVLTGGGVNYVFYLLFPLHFTSSLFAPTSRFSSPHWMRYCHRSRSRSCVCSAGWDTVAAANLASDTLGWGRFLCRWFLDGRRRRSRCSDRCRSAGGGTPS